MSNEQSSRPDYNQDIVKRTKKILEEQGYKVKISHLYELFSKLSGVKDWNAAKALKKDFKNLLTQSATINKIPFLSTPLADDEFYLGNKEDGTANVVNQIVKPGVFMVGGLGVGKSQASYIYLLTKLLSSPNSLAFIIDPLTGASDYKSLFSLDRVVPVLNDRNFISLLFEWIMEEIQSRRVLFEREGVNNIHNYEEKTGQKLSRILLHFENFHAIPIILKWFLNQDREGTAAYNLKMITRVGRSYGIFLSAASLRATSEDLPYSLKPGFINLMAFKMNNYAEASALNFPKAMEIKSEERGKCITDMGVVQWPYLDETSRDLYEKSLPTKGLPKTLTLSPLKLKSLKSGDMSKYLPEKTIKDLVKNIDDTGISETLKVILQKLGYTVNNFNGKYQIIFSLTKDNEKTLVMVNSKDGINTSKHLPILKETMKTSGHQKGLVIIYDGISTKPDSLTNEPIDWLDKEDLEYL